MTDTSSGFCIFYSVDDHDNVLGRLLLTASEFLGWLFGGFGFREVVREGEGFSELGFPLF